MSKALIAVLGTIGVFLVCFIIFVSMYVHFNNREVVLANLIKAKQTDNQSQFDNTYKTISQTAQVTQAQWQVLKDIIIGNAQARKGSGSLATSVTEAVPNVDTSTTNQLINIITAARNTFTENQRELLDYNREHDNLIDLFPSSFFVSLGGKHKIDVTIVTSDRTENAFKTGKDNDTNVFQK